MLCAQPAVRFEYFCPGFPDFLHHCRKTSGKNGKINLSQYFKSPEDIRRIIYTTNTIEAVHRQFRKLTKTKGAFPNQDSLLKLLYMGIQNASKKWTMPIQNWSLTISQLAIFFEGRLDKELKL